MKGFPNQVAKIDKVAVAVRDIAALAAADKESYDDDILGEAFVRSGVAGRGRPPKAVATYLAEQRLKPKSSQSHRTTARGMRELLAAMGLIDISKLDKTVTLTRLGQAAAARPPAPLNGTELLFWRQVVRRIERTDGQGTSHPYLVLLRLVAARPGITRALCALALEARDDSPAELARIVTLSNLSEEQARQATGASRANWDNAKKVLPSFAEQLGDVVRNAGGGFMLAVAPGAGGGMVSGAAAPASAGGAGARQVDATTIGKAGLSEEDELPPATAIGAAAVAAANALRAKRLKDHNKLVRAIAQALQQNGATLYEHPYDILAVFPEAKGLLIEVKTLDGTLPDELHQVRDALSQLLYYEAFARRPRGKELTVTKLAYFDRPPTDDHAAFLLKLGVKTMSGQPQGAVLRALVS